VLAVLQGHGVDDDVPHSYGLPPRNARVGGSPFLRDVPRGLAERLDEMGDCEAKVLVRLPFLRAPSGHLAVSSAGGIEHVLEVDPVVTLHDASRPNEGLSP